MGSLAADGRPSEHDVLAAPFAAGWFARLVTLPRAAWVVPGTSTALRFVGPDLATAERAALRFLRGHLRATGSRVVRIETLPAAPTVRLSAAAPPSQPPALPAPRKECVLPVRYALSGREQFAEVANVSESGLFVRTVTPLNPGAAVRMRVELDACSMPLHGTVVWNRPVPDTGRPAGMGVRLAQPPALYVGYVRALPAPYSC